MFNYSYTYDPAMVRQHYEEILKKAAHQHLVDRLQSRSSNGGARMPVSVLQALFALLPLNVR